MKRMMIAVSLCLMLTSVFAMTPTKEQKVPKKDVVRIGGVFALSGPAQVIGIPSQKVMEYLVKNFNSSQDKVEVKAHYADTKSNPAEAAIAMKRMIQRNKVVAVVGPTTTGSAMASLGTITKARIPMLACVGGTVVVEPVDKRKWAFKSPQTSRLAIQKMYGYLKKTKNTKIVVLHSDDKFGQEGLSFLKEYSPEFKIQVLDKFAFNRGAIDFKILLKKALDLKPDAVIVWTIGAAGPNIARNYSEIGGKALMMQCHGQPTPDYVRGAGEHSNGNVMPSTKVMVADQLEECDPQKKVLKDFIQFYEKDAKIGEVGAHSGYAWDAVQIVLGAIEKGARSSKEIHAGIENTKDYIGVSGIYNMSAKDHCGLGLDSLVMVEVKDGNFHLIK